MKCNESSEEFNGNLREETAFALGLDHRQTDKYTEKIIDRKEKASIPERMKSTRRAQQ